MGPLKCHLFNIYDTYKCSDLQCKKLHNYYFCRNFFNEGCTEATCKYMHIEEVEVKLYKETANLTASIRREAHRTGQFFGVCKRYHRNGSCSESPKLDHIHHVISLRENNRPIECCVCYNKLTMANIGAMEYCKHMICQPCFYRLEQEHRRGELCRNCPICRKPSASFIKLNCL